MEQSSSMLHGKEDMFVEMGIPVHSQVRKIKQEISSTKIIDWCPGQTELRHHVSRERNRQQRSRSPLGLAGSRSMAVPVGDS